jgi:cysteine desulfurase
MAERCPTWAFSGRDRSRLPNTSSVFIPGVRADDLVVALDLEGILISAGAACSSGKPEPSHVLLAMDQDAQRVKSTVRISFRADIEPKDVERLVDVLCTVAGRMNRSA